MRREWAFIISDWQCHLLAATRANRFITHPVSVRNSMPWRTKPDKIEVSVAFLIACWPKNIPRCVCLIKLTINCELNLNELIDGLYWPKPKPGHTMHKRKFNPHWKDMSFNLQIASVFFVRLLGLNEFLYFRFQLPIPLPEDQSACPWNKSCGNREATLIQPNRPVIDLLLQHTCFHSSKAQCEQCAMIKLYPTRLFRERDAYCSLRANEAIEVCRLTRRWFISYLVYYVNQK